MASVRKPLVFDDDKEVQQLQSGDTIAKADVGLSNVDNTSDADKPVSTLQAASIGTKVAKQTMTDNAIVRADSTAGEVQNSGITIDDNNNIVLPAIVFAEAKGIVYKGTAKFIHSYIPGYDTGGGVMAAAGFGGNVFIGLNAGNTTMTATNISAGGGNIGIGSAALSGLTGVGGGYQNTGIGINAGILISTGTNNFAMGPNSLTKVTTTSDNVAIGSTAGQFFTGSGNTFIGTQSGKGVNGTSTGSYNMTLGFQAGLALTSSTYNILIGATAGNTITSGSRNVIIGIGWNGAAASALNPSSATVSDELNIGGAFFGKLGTVKSFGIGLTDATSITARFHLPAGSTAASSAPLKLNSGSLLTASEAGALEFLTDRITFTGTTGPTRKDLADLVYRGISALRTLDGSDELVDCTANSFVVTLPTAVGYTKKYTIKNSGTGVITIATTSSQTIDGQESGTITLSQYEAIALRSNGSNWIIV